MATLATLHRYPVKSCRGEELDTATVEPWGLAGDRRWLVVDDAGDFVTAREEPRLLLVVPTTRADGGLQLEVPGAGTLSVDVPPPGELTGVRVWRSRLDATPAGGADNALSEHLGRRVRLVYLDDPTRRPTDPAYTLPTDRVSFADAYPLLLTSTASLAALNAMIEQDGRAAELAGGPLPMARFRPNVVVDRTEAWDEDGWRVVRIGDAVFRAVKGCDRCAMTMTDPATARRGKEPIATLARHRRWDGEVWFGMNLVPDTPDAVVRVGDEVEVLACEPAPDGPPR